MKRPDTLDLLRELAGEVAKTAGVASLPRQLLDLMLREGGFTTRPVVLDRGQLARQLGAENSRGPYSPRTIDEIRQLQLADLVISRGDAMRLTARLFDRVAALHRKRRP